MTDATRFYGTRPELLPDVLPAGSVYKGRYRLLEPARAHAMERGRHEHVATFDTLNCTTDSARPAEFTWGADAESIDWETVPVPDAQRRACPSRRDKRDVHFRSLVSMLEATLHDHQFSPSELRDACLLAATRYEMRTNRREFRLSEGEIVEFMRRTNRNEAGERAIEARESPYLAAQLANIRPREE